MDVHSCHGANSESWGFLVDSTFLIGRCKGLHVGIFYWKKLFEVEEEEKCGDQREKNERKR